MKVSKLCFNMRTQHLGDLVMALPAITSCLNQDVQVGVYIAKQYTRLFQHLEIDWLSRWLPTEYEARRITHTGHRADMWANQVRKYGIEVNMERPPMVFDKYQGPLPDNYVVLAPYCDERKKQWDVIKFNYIGRWLIANGMNVVIIGPLRAKAMCSNIESPGVINLCGMDTVTNWPDIIYRAKTVVCPDTGTSHIASLVGTHPVTLFGHTKASVYAPYWSKQYVASAKNMHLLEIDTVKRQIERVLNNG